VDAENPTATRDGRWVVYNSSNPAKSGIWRIRPDGTGPERIVPGAWSTPEVSPDGLYVAFRTRNATGPRSVSVARIESGEVARFEVEILRDNNSARPRWIPDGKSLAFTGTDGSGARGIFVQPFSPGRDTRGARRGLFPFDPSLPVESFAVSPDGRHVVYSTIETPYSLMIAEGLSGVTPPERRSSQ
jgi:Tol biopolymer transport system component